MPLVLNISGSECARVLDIPQFWICQSYIGFRISLNNFWIFVNMPDYVWICINMPEYARIFVNMHKSDWIAFVLQFPNSPFVLQSLFYLKRDDLFACLQKTRDYNFKEREVAFLKIQDLTFSLAARSISFGFLLDWIFLQVWFNFAVTLRSRDEGRSWALWILI